MKVKAVKCFKELQEAWGFNYPKLNEVLSVESVKNYDGQAKILTIMLKFKEYPYLPWMCLCDHMGNSNFDIIIDISKTIEEELDQLKDN